MNELKVFVTTEEITEEERKAMPKLIGIDLDWYARKWAEIGLDSLEELIMESLDER